MNISEAVLKAKQIDGYIARQGDRSPHPRFIKPTDGYDCCRLHLTMRTWRDKDMKDEMSVTRAYVSMILNGSRKPNGIKKRMEEAVVMWIRKKSAIRKKGGNEKKKSLDCFATFFRV